MRFVPVKTVEQQAALSVHRIRALLINQRTQLTNALRAHLAELGLVADHGRDGLAKLIAMLREENTLQLLPFAMLGALRALISQLASVQQEIGELDRCIHDQHRASAVSRRLESIPGVGVIGARALAATVTDPSSFKSGRDLAAWIGLVPRQYSTGGKERLGGISKQGDRYLRRLLVAGAMAVVQHARRHPDKRPWVTKLLARKPAKVVAIAIANKTARIAWAIMVNGGTYRAPAITASA